MLLFSFKLPHLEQFSNVTRSSLLYKVYGCRSIHSVLILKVYFRTQVTAIVLIRCPENEGMSINFRSPFTAGSWHARETENKNNTNIAVELLKE